MDRLCIIVRTILCYLCNLNLLCIYEILIHHISSLMVSLKELVQNIQISLCFNCGQRDSSFIRFEFHLSPYMAVEQKVQSPIIPLSWVYPTRIYPEMFSQ